MEIALLIRGMKEIRVDDGGEGSSPLQSPPAPVGSPLPDREENELGEEDSTSERPRNKNLDVGHNKHHLIARRIDSKALKRQQPKATRTKVSKPSRKDTRATRASHRLEQRRRGRSPAEQERDGKRIQAALDKTGEEELDPRNHGPKDAEEMVAQAYNAENIYWETEDEPLSDDLGIVAHLLVPSICFSVSTN